MVEEWVRYSVHNYVRHVGQIHARRMQPTSGHPAVLSRLLLGRVTH